MTALTQQQLADRLGMSPSRITDHERGIKRGTRQPAVIPKVVELALAKIEKNAEGERKP